MLPPRHSSLSLPLLLPFPSAFLSLPLFIFLPPSLYVLSSPPTSLLGKALLYSDMPGSIYGGAAKHVTLNSSPTLLVHLSQLCGWIHWRWGERWGAGGRWGRQLQQTLVNIPETFCGAAAQLKYACVCAEKILMVSVEPDWSWCSPGGDRLGGTSRADWCIRAGPAPT